MMDHEKHEKIQVIYLLEDYSYEIQSLVMVEEELELPLENGQTIFEEVHNSTTLEPTHEEIFAFFREMNNNSPMDPSHYENVSLLNIWVSWFFLLHPTLLNFAAIILMKYE